MTVVIVGEKVLVKVPVACGSQAGGSTLAYFCSRSRGDDHPGPMKVSLDFEVGNQISKTSSSFDSVD
jgi:hypothetical protein